MPTLHRFNGLRVVIYLNDHRPAHVHVVGANAMAVFVLNCLEGPPELRENHGFKRSDLAAIKVELAAVLAQLCAKWSEMHGNY
jgi:metal-dependent HD superfamily phosphatase/phosphodiesterase